jgi:hypothetical protein
LHPLFTVELTQSRWCAVWLPPPQMQVGSSIMLNLWWFALSAPCPVNIVIIGKAKYEGICLQPILCKDKCGVARYGAERRIT